jgi:Uma2 family endonuclease
LTTRRRLLEALLVPVEPPRMTYEEFLAWADEDTLAEWVALPGEEVGEVIMTSPASNRHQDVSGFLESVMRMYVEARNLGVLRSAPFQMKLEHGREPDLIFLRREHLDRLKENYLDGPADLVVEIVLPESVGRDRGEKFYEYARGGVPEYWLIEPEMQWTEFYRLEGERYRVVLDGREGEYRSQVLPGFWLRVEWLWQEPLPSPLRALAEIVGMDAALVEAFERALRGGDA